MPAILSNQDFGNIAKAVNLLDPTNPQDAATMAYCSRVGTVAAPPDSKVSAVIGTLLFGQYTIPASITNVGTLYVASGATMWTRGTANTNVIFEVLYGGVVILSFTHTSWVTASGSFWGIFEAGLKFLTVGASGTANAYLRHLSPWGQSVPFTYTGAVAEGITGLNTTVAQALEVRMRTVAAAAGTVFAVSGARIERKWY